MRGSQPETSYRAEFVAALGNQPQGGFVTRKPTEVGVADDHGFFSVFQRRWSDAARGSARQEALSFIAVPSPNRRGHKNNVSAVLTR
jgi:hypothetical protein